MIFCYTSFNMKSIKYSVKFVLKAHGAVPRFSRSFFRSLFMRSKSVLRMKSAEIWNYLVLCTHVYTSRILEGPGLRESIEFSNKSVALPRALVSYNICIVSLFTATACVTRAQFARNFTRHLRGTPAHCSSQRCEFAARGEKKKRKNSLLESIFGFSAIVSEHVPDM